MQHLDPMQTYWIMACILTRSKFCQTIKSPHVWIKGVPLQMFPLKRVSRENPLLINGCWNNWVIIAPFLIRLLLASVAVEWLGHRILLISLCNLQERNTSPHFVEAHSAQGMCPRPKPCSCSIQTIQYWRHIPESLLYTSFPRVCQFHDSSSVCQAQTDLKPELFSAPNTINNCSQFASRKPGQFPKAVLVSGWIPWYAYLWS